MCSIGPNAPIRRKLHHHEGACLAPTARGHTTTLAEAEGQPGALRGLMPLDLETHQDQRMVKGRRGRADTPIIVGLIGFANLLPAIWHGAQARGRLTQRWVEPPRGEANCAFASGLCLCAYQFRFFRPVKRPAEVSVGRSITCAT